MNKKTVQKTNLTAQVNKDVKAAIEKRAKDEDRSVSWVTNNILSKALDL